MIRVVSLLLVLSGALCFAQDSSSAAPLDTCGAKHIDRCLADLAQDQAGIWTSAFHLHAGDAAWLLPFAGATTAALAYDNEAMRDLGTNKSRIDTSHKIADFGSPEATIGEGVGLYAIGALSHNDKLAETGRLGAEAVVDASVVAQVVKLAANRDRPDQGEHTGEFWPSGTKGYTINGSFPSGHATASWALARVVADEYKGWAPRLLAYGFATAVSVSRVTSRDHFPSDVLVGSGIGFLTGGYVYRHHSVHSEKAPFAIAPMFDARTHTAGLQAQIAPGSFRHLLRGF